MHTLCFLIICFGVILRRGFEFCRKPFNWYNSNSIRTKNESAYVIIFIKHKKYLTFLTSFRTGELQLNNNNLEGIIPDYLYSFTSLEHFNLGFNNLYGTIHNEIGNLYNLSKFQMASLKKYTIYTKILTQHKKDFLHLESNQFTGVLPNSGNLTNLVEFFVGDNNWSGDILYRMQNARNLSKLVSQ